MQRAYAFSEQSIGKEPKQYRRHHDLPSLI